MAITEQTLLTALQTVIDPNTGKLSEDPKKKNIY